MQKELQILNYRRFRPCVFASAPLQRLHTAMLWAEGPVYFADLGVLLVSDIPRDRSCASWMAQAPTDYRQPSGHANGNTRDR